MTRFEVKKSQLKFFPSSVTFKRRAHSKQMANTSDEEKRVTGFTLNWFLEDRNGNQVTERLPSRAEDWKQKVPTPKYEQPLLAEMVQLARQLRLQNMTEDEILEEVIHKKLQNIKIFDEDGMCSMEQVKPENLEKVFSSLKLVLNVNMNTTDEPLTDEDIRTGYRIFHAIAYCPIMVLKLFRFIDQLLSVESSRTIIQTFVNLFQSEAIRDETIFLLARQFYKVL